MTGYRSLTAAEISCLEAHGCRAADWNLVRVAPSFVPDNVIDVCFSGMVYLGIFEDSFTLPGGVVRHSGICHAVLHNVTVGDNCRIEWVKNYIANYEIGEYSYIGNVDTLLVDGESSFGNGVEVTVLNETGGREVVLFDALSAHEAYMMAFYRHRPALIEGMRRMIGEYVHICTSAKGTIGSWVTIRNVGRIENVRIGDCCMVRGAARLTNGSVNSTAGAPVVIGEGVLCDDFIVSSGSRITDGAMLTRCFVGQSVHIGHGYSATDSLFFCNCQEENGEACAVFAGPFTVTHHKSTLLIGGMFSFMNAGSGSNQSNHMYKLGPSHQGILERGSKTASSSYILWPARIGAFSMVMGHHVSHPDTADLPFSYLIEDKGVAFLVPGLNLRSVGTARDVEKWPKRDGRTDKVMLDLVIFDALSPYTVGKLLDGIRLLRQLESGMAPGDTQCICQGMVLKRTALERGIRLYQAAVDKFFGGQLMRRLDPVKSDCWSDYRKRLVPETCAGTGKWVDLSGLLTPESEVERLVRDIENNRLTHLVEVRKRLEEMYAGYQDYVWEWVSGKLPEVYGWHEETLSAEDVCSVIRRWLEAVTWLDGQVYEDALKEFSQVSMTGFGIDGGEKERKDDFEAVRGTAGTNDFMNGILAGKAQAEKKGNGWISRLTGLS